MSAHLKDNMAFHVVAQGSLQQEICYSSDMISTLTGPRTIAAPPPSGFLHAQVWLFLNLAPCREHS